jgi:DNA-binding GntR family transcriptional regulator
MSRAKNANGATAENPARLGGQLLNPALPKTAQVYDLVRRAIIGLELRPGAPINEKQICEQLNISRTPLREAILRLHAERLVEVWPNAGTHVSPIDLQEVMDGQIVREALEMKVIRLAAVKMTREADLALEFNMHQQKVFADERNYDRFYDLDESMHQIICEQGSSPRVWNIVTGAKAHLDRVRRLAFPEDHHLDIVLAEHAAIVDALKARDPDAAHAAMGGHLNRVFKTMRLLLSRRSEFFAANSAHELDDLQRLYET